MNEPDDFPDLGNEQEARRIAVLASAYIQGKLTAEQQVELEDWLESSEDNVALFEKLTDEVNLEKALKLYQSFDSKKAYERLKGRLPENQLSSTRRIAPDKVFLAAASFLVIAVSVYLLFRNSTEGSKPVVVQNETKEIYPAQQHVRLVLSDGNFLDVQPGDAKAINEKNSTIDLNHDQISYKSPENSANVQAYNKIEVPYGNTFRVILSDGSKVWLNAQSTMRYPVAFSGGERNVEITGEAYFEVAHRDSTQRFVVSVMDNVGGIKETVRVLGTHFNVNAYKENFVTTSLFEGSVKVKDVFLKPGEQSLSSDGRVSVKDQFSNEEILAWKNGNFYFKDETVENIMAQVARWYNVRITYENKIDFHFNAEIPRDVPVSKLLRILELTNTIHFKTIADAKEGRAGQIIVMK